MGMFVNSVELIGNLGRDPEIRPTQQGRIIATLNLATSESWKDQQTGEWRDRTEWHRVVVFNEGLAKIAEKHLTKGMKVRVVGKLRTRKWQDQAGQDRYSTEVSVEAFDGAISFDIRRDDEGASGAGRTQVREPAMATTGGGTGPGFHTAGDLDDEIPFAPCWQ